LYIADAAQAFGQQNDITVLAIRRLAQGAVTYRHGPYAVQP
jgi:hypothetical protein